jgi:hypothetical protein
MLLEQDMTMFNLTIVFVLIISTLLVAFSVAES